MIDKIKGVFEYLKGNVLAIIAAVVGLIAYILSIKSKTRDLRDDLAVSKSETQLAEVLAKKKEADNEANKQLGDYVSLRDEYIKQHPDGK